MSNMSNLTRKLKSVATGQDQERRRYKRREIEKHLGSYIVDSDGKEHAVSVVDISENGMSLDLRPMDSVKLKADDQVGVRLYVSKTNFIHLELVIRATEHFKTENYQRIHSSFSVNGRSDVTMYHLVRFIEIMAHIIESNEKLARAA